MGISISVLPKRTFGTVTSPAARIWHSSTSSFRLAPSSASSSTDRALDTRSARPRPILTSRSRSWQSSDSRYCGQQGRRKASARRIDRCLSSGPESVRPGAAMDPCAATASCAASTKCWEPNGRWDPPRSLNRQTPPHLPPSQLPPPTDPVRTGATRPRPMANAAEAATPRARRTETDASRMVMLRAIFNRELSRRYFLTRGMDAE